MAKFTVRSYVAIDIEVDMSEWDEDMDQESLAEEAANQAGIMITKIMNDNNYDYDFMEEPLVYDEDGEELEFDQ